jgi:hypothetical protein
VQRLSFVPAGYWLERRTSLTAHDSEQVSGPASLSRNVITCYFSCVNRKLYKDRARKNDGIVGGISEAIQVEILTENGPCPSSFPRQHIMYHINVQRLTNASCTMHHVGNRARLSYATPRHWGMLCRITHNAPRRSRVDVLMVV